MSEENAEAMESHDKRSESSLTTPPSIVEFSNPPVAEVVLSVAFEPLPGLTLAKLVLAWERNFKETFPESEEQPRWQPPIEQFGSERFGSGLRLEVGGLPPASRLWFLNKQGTNLLQLQNDWFARNWRKQEESAEYIRYAKLRGAFADEFSAFLQFVAEEGLGQIVASQCELTYIDHIEPNEYWSTHADVGNVFRILNLQSYEFLAPTPEDFRFAMTYVIPGDEGQPIGRLYMNAQPAIRKNDNVPIFVVSTTARGAPASNGLDGILHFLDHGHTWAVRGFMDVTTDEMLKAWGRKDD